MKHLTNYNAFFIFLKSSTGSVDLLDDRVWEKREDAEKMCRNELWTQAMEYLYPDRIINAKACYMCQAEIKTRPDYLAAFKRYFGESRVEFFKNDKGKITHFAIRGIDSTWNLKKSDLVSIAKIHSCEPCSISRLTRTSVGKVSKIA
jgi:hypothetical protein